MAKLTVINFCSVNYCCVNQMLTIKYSQLQCLKKQANDIWLQNYTSYFIGFNMQVFDMHTNNIIVNIYSFNGYDMTYQDIKCRHDIWHKTFPYHGTTTVHKTHMSFSEHCITDYDPNNTLSITNENSTRYINWTR